MRTYVLAGILLVTAGFLAVAFARRRPSLKGDFVDSNVLARINTEY
jgi:hypothetical protein